MPMLSSNEETGELPEWHSRLVLQCLHRETCRQVATRARTSQISRGFDEGRNIQGFASSDSMTCYPCADQHGDPLNMRCSSLAMLAQFAPKSDNKSQGLSTNDSWWH